MPPTDLRAVGDRIERLLDDLRTTADPRSYATAEELLRLVTELYGAAVARMMELVGEDTPSLVAELAADELVASVLLVHGLHPDTLDARVQRALESVRPFLAQHGGDVELVDLDAEFGAVRLRLLGNCDGCPSSTVTLQMAVERAIVDAAPEVVVIDVDQPAADAPPGASSGVPSGAPVPVSLGTKPAFDRCPTGVGSE
jgi:Fe-S cluster biogenesis protein NfuA